MNKKMIIVVVVLATLSVAYSLFYIREYRTDGTVQLTASKSTADVQNDVSVGPNDSGVVNTTTANAASKGTPRDIDLAEFKRLDPIITALDEKESLWLKKHGYPTKNDIENLDLMTQQQLAVRISQKDPMGSVLSGLKAEKAGDLQNAATDFSIASRRGSLYARQRYAELNRANYLQSSANADPYDANADYLAELELARYMGDHRAGERQAARILPQGTRFGDYSRDVLSLFQGLLGQYNSSYQREFGRMPKPDPRPNAERWAEIDAGRVKTVTIYVPYK